MILKKHVNKKTILTVVDNNLVGKCYKEKDLQLDLCSDFYKGETINEKNILDKVKGVNILHIIGADSIKWSIENKLIDSNNIRKIKNIPFAFVVMED